MTTRVQFRYTNPASRRSTGVALAGVASIGLLAPALAHAYETDQLTDRLVPLRDAALDAERQIVARGWLWEHYTTPTLRVGTYRVGAAKP